MTVTDIKSPTQAGSPTAAAIPSAIDKATSVSCLERSQPAVFVGDSIGMRRAQKLSVPTDPCRPCPIHDLDHVLQDAGSPASVLCLAIDSGFDCMDVAAVLRQRNFNGQFKVFAADIPRPGLIRDELRRACPSLDIEIIH